MKAELYARLRKLENDIDLYHTAYDSLCKVISKEKNNKTYLQTATQLSAQLLGAKGKYADLQRSLLEEDKVNNSNNKNMKIINERIDFFSEEAREETMKVESKMLMSQIQKYVDERRKNLFR